MPLSEIITAVLGVSYPGAKKVWTIYNLLVTKFEDEYTVLMDASEEEMNVIIDPKIAEAIVRVREEKSHVIPGYDGVYGQLIIFEEKQENSTVVMPKQKRIADFI